MSVLIKGMTRPKNCFECHLTKWVDDGCAGCWADDKIHNASRPDDCPLVEVKEPHGRLIDGDALKETLDYYICEANWGDEVNKGLRWVKDEFINSENTVIEAEGSENHAEP